MLIYWHMADSSTSVSRRLALNLEQLRRKHGLTQAVLAKRAGVPRSTLTHLESGEGNPSLHNLARIAGALRVSIEELLAAPRPEVQLIKAADLPRAERAQGSVALVRLLPDAVPGLQIERMEIRPGGWMRGTPHVQGTKEYLTVIEGTTRVGVMGQSYLVSQGDVLAFPGDQPHSYNNPGKRRCVSLSVVALVPAGV